MPDPNDPNNPANHVTCCDEAEEQKKRLADYRGKQPNQKTQSTDDEPLLKPATQAPTGSKKMAPGKPWPEEPQTTHSLEEIKRQIDVAIKNSRRINEDSKSTSDENRELRKFVIDRLKVEAVQPTAQGGCPKSRVKALEQLRMMTLTTQP